MKYANYIHACVQTILVGKHHIDVYSADAQSHLRHAIVQNSMMLPTKMLVRTRYVQFLYFMGRVYPQVLRILRPL